MAFDPENTFELLVRKTRNLPNPITENTLFGSFIVVFNACPFEGIWMSKTLTSLMLSSQGREVTFINGLHDQLAKHIIWNENVLRQQADNNSKGNKNMKVSYHPKHEGSIVGSIYHAIKKTMMWCVERQSGDDDGTVR